MTESIFFQGSHRNTEKLHDPGCYQSGDTVTLAPPTCEGYTFIGWYADTSFQRKCAGITKNSSGNQVFYARWTMASFTLTFVPAKGTLSQKTKTVTFKSTYGELTTPSRKAYTYKGWYTGIMVATLSPATLS
ncbi:InlB B-repeat-containing protein [Robinsoniella peoriensis]|uniref:InlB B-repeat-containing protein n=1 Tax=Robinsoniella peoriensis TaxID=180332 RepID=UPI00085BD6BC